MRFTLLIVLICLLANRYGLAQSRPDQIFLLDKTSQNAFVDEIGETNITYFLPADANRQNPMQILKSKVWQIVFANGDVELINPLPAEPVSPPKVIVPDRIFTTSNTIVEARVIRIGQSTVEYRRMEVGANSPVFELPLQNVVRIELADGSVKTFSAGGVNGNGPGTVDAGSPPASQEQVTRKPSRLRESRPLKTSSYGAGGLSEKWGITASVVGSYVYKEPYWQADSNGVGLRQGLGGSLSIHYKVAQWLALSLQGGYNQFLSNRTYLTPDQDTLYTARYTLITIPAQLGLKIYLAKPVYLGVYGGMNYLITKFDSYSDYSLETKRFSPTGTAVLGFEPRLGIVKLDLAIQYNYATVNATGEYAASPALHIPQFKLGFGF